MFTSEIQQKNISSYTLKMNWNSVSHVDLYGYKTDHFCPAILFCVIHKLHYKICDVSSVGRQILEDNLALLK